MTKAYVLIEADRGGARDVVIALQGLSNVEVVDLVTGPYDVIATVAGSDPNAVGRLILNDIRGLPGVRQTLTCLVFESPQLAEV